MESTDVEPPEFRPDCRPWVGPADSQWRDADMTATFGADVPWHKLAQENGLWLPVDCQGDPAASIGQLVSRNSTGPLRLGFGAWRDLLLGCQFENGRGELITAGGVTVKNVAGYDLTKFMVGQSGVFGRIVAVTTRVYRKPQDALLAEFPPDMSIFNRLLVCPCRPQWAILTHGSLTCGYLGTARTVDYFQQQLPAHQPRRLDRGGFSADAQWRIANWTVAQGAGLPMRASVPPMRIAEFSETANLTHWVGDPAYGIVLARASEQARESIIAAAKRVGGRAWFAAGDSFAPDEWAILQRLKKAIDPDNRLAALTSLSS